MDLGLEEFQEIIYTRLVRTKMYLQEYIKHLPRYLMALRHKFEHPLSELHILTQQLVPESAFENDLHLMDIKTDIPQNLNYFDLALNEIKTALEYIEKRENNQIFQEIWNEELKRKITRIIRALEDIKNSTK